MDPIYLDYSATTPVRVEVRDAMLPLLTELFGNASSLHRWGREARAALDLRVAADRLLPGVRRCAGLDADPPVVRLGRPSGSPVGTR